MSPISGVRRPRAFSFRTASLACSVRPGADDRQRECDGQASGAALRNQFVRLPSCLPVSATGLSAVVWEDHLL